MVVQTGVEYGDTSVFGYERSRAAELSLFAKNTGTFVYEAHSTDYQTPRALRELVEDHFAVLKVGPWLTFAFREAVFALCRIEEEWLADHKSVTLSEIPAILEGVMRRQPDSWMDYYRGDESQLRYACKYSYSDRSRYYWPQPALREALDRLVANLGAYPPPLACSASICRLSTGLSRDGRLALNVHQLIEHKIREVLKVYWEAVAPGAWRKLPARARVR